MGGGWDEGRRPRSAGGLGWRRRLHFRAWGAVGGDEAGVTSWGQGHLSPQLHSLPTSPRWWRFLRSWRPTSQTNHHKDRKKKTSIPEAEKGELRAHHYQKRSPPRRSLHTFFFFFFWVFRLAELWRRAWKTRGRQTLRNVGQTKLSVYSSNSFQDLP